MKSKNLCVLAVDPGKMSGIAMIRYDGTGEPELMHSFEADFDMYADTIREMVYLSAEVKAGLVVVCERFTINAQTVRNTQSPYSLEQIGILKQVLFDAERHLKRPGGILSTLSMQAPSDAKNMFPNPALKKLGYWHVGGDGHALDAIRHGLLRAVKEGWVPRRLLESQKDTAVK